MIRNKPRTRRAVGALMLAGASAYSSTPGAHAHAHRPTSKVAGPETEAPFSAKASHDADGSAAYAQDSWHAARLARLGEMFTGTPVGGITPKGGAARRRGRTEPGLQAALLAALAGALFVLQRRRDH